MHRQLLTTPSRSCEEMGGEIIESDVYSDSDPEETCDSIEMGNEVTKGLLETAFEICSERFFHANAPSSVSRELRNTWLRIMEAQLLDEYKPEIGSLTSKVFQPDHPPAPLPFDSWSRGTLEVLDPAQQVRDAKSKLLAKSTDSKVGQTLDNKLTPPKDASYTENIKWTESDGEGDLPNVALPYLTLLFKGKDFSLHSNTKLLAEDGFNIPIGHYSPAYSDIALPPRTNNQHALGVVEGSWIVIGEDELDNKVVDEDRKTIQGKKRRNQNKRNTALTPEDAMTSKAMQARSIVSNMKFWHQGKWSHARESAKNREILRAKNPVKPVNEAWLKK